MAYSLLKIRIYEMLITFMRRIVLSQAFIQIMMLLLAY